MNGNDRSIVGFVMVAHATVHTYELAIPIMMTVWLVEFSTTLATLGAVVAVGYGLFGIGALPGGILVDRFGSRMLVVASFAGMGLSFLALSAASSLATIALALCLWGVAASVYHPAGLSLISNGVDERGRGFGLHGAAGNVGVALGPLATALLLLAFEWRTVAVILVTPAAVGVVYGLTVRFDETAVVEGTARADGGVSIGTFVRDSRALLTATFSVVLVIVMLNGLYYRGMVTFLPDVLGDLLAAPLEGIELVDPRSPLAEEFDPARYVYAALLLVGVLGQYAGGRLVDRVRTETGLAATLVVLAGVTLAFVPAALAGTGPFVAVALVLALAMFAIQPLGQATVAAYSRPEVRGLSFGYTYLSIFGVGALGAAIAGAVLTHATIPVLFVVLAAFAAAGSALSAWLVRRG